MYDGGSLFFTSIVICGGLVVFSFLRGEETKRRRRGMRHGIWNMGYAVLMDLGYDIDKRA